MSNSWAVKVKMEKTGKDDNILKCTCIPNLACCLAACYLGDSLSMPSHHGLEPRYVKGVADEPVDSFENCVQLIERLDRAWRHEGLEISVLPTW